MYLKSIEIQGFKSFANKIKLDFHNGFTAIVGPNGSGKSNIADAVRWVLGEQSARQLRGGSMQDVIFSGTELRKPLSCASVAITLDNADHRLPVDYNEVTVMRRLYRSGESVYMINGTQCRLRDVQEMFYDTGIGKEGYSIIGQGQIDKILSDKPEDRRELFDEAAGIVKFKHRKDTTLKKLESEQENLQRVDDILGELEKQVEPLKKASEKARTYLDTREQMKRLDVNAFLLENGEAQKTLSDLNIHIENASAELDSAKAEYVSAGERAEQLREKAQELDKAIESARDEIARTNIVRGKLEGDIKVCEEQIRSASAQQQQAQQSLKKITDQLVQLEGQLSEEQTKKAQTDIQVENLLNAKKEQNLQLEGTKEQSGRISDTIDENRTQLMDLLSERSGIKSKLASLSTLKEQDEDRLKRLSENLGAVQTDSTGQDRHIEELRAQFLAVSQEIEELKKRQNAIDQEILGKKEQLTQTDDRLRGAQAEYNRRRSTLEALINLTERYEGFGGSVRRVMQEKESNPGVIGVVADLIKTEARYENAIEVALGGSIQNIVVDTEETARAMISILKAEKAGRATFLPISAMQRQSTFSMQGVLTEPGIIGLASTLVRIKPEYNCVAQALLGRIVVADNFDHATACARKYQHKLRMVTLDGELFAAGGAISGGTFRNSSNLLGRRREIADLRQQAQQAQQSVSECEQAIVRIKKERNDLRSELESNRMRQQQLFLDQNTARVSIEQEESRKEESQDNLARLQEEKKLLEDELSDILRQRTEYTDQLEQSADCERKLQEAITSLNTQLQDIRKSEDSQTADAAQRDVEIGRIQKTQQFQEREIERISGEIDNLRIQRTQTEASIAESVRTVKEKQEYLQRTQATIDSSHSAETEGGQRLRELNEKRKKTADEQQDVQAMREEMLARQNDLDKELYRLQSQQQKAQESMDSQINYLWDEYEITPSDAKSFRDESLTAKDLKEMKRQIAALKKTIRDLGPVNVNAIEEYKQVGERYEFLKGQHDDLVSAADSLQKIIHELDANMRKQFKEQFGRIQVEFDKVFKQLFGGGEGRLELMEDEDILTAGVRVIAQPPGKKLVNMMQMSGGEKALTAISLLFAIQNLKPSPFCLLDEIEAALDESNVTRFAEYIGKLTQNTQFIVITHRRGTMEHADRLYGVTMQEKGVTTLVSVSLVENQLTA